jgi:hypothetical protein
MCWSVDAHEYHVKVNENCVDAAACEIQENYSKFRQRKSYVLPHYIT